MELLDAVLIVIAGMAAGTINVVVGSGTLITFPVLIALGYPPVQANVSNNIGLVPGSLSGAVAYRRELAGQRARMIGLGIFSTLGGLAGAVVLLTMPSSAFDAIVPVLIASAMLLVVIQPRLTIWLADRRRAENASHPALRALIFGTGVYGGYFGAAQGIILLGVLGLALPDDLHRINALKNVLAGLVNGMAALVFILVADVNWAVVGLIASGSLAGGILGGRYGRRLPPPALRVIIVIVGTVAIVRLLA